MSSLFVACLLLLAPAPDPVLVEIPDQPGLPRVLLVGDSISMGYTLPVREALKGKANVHRIGTNGGDTERGLKTVDKWLGDGKWDVIHFNFGLHDLKVLPNEKHQVELDVYAKNLEAIVAKLQKTGAKVIWATTTPVPAGANNPKRVTEDVLKYNEAAKKVADAAKLAIDDLYTFVLPKLGELQLPHNVHFKPAGYKALAGEVVKSLEAALAK